MRFVLKSNSVLSLQRQPNGERYRRGGLTRLLDIIAPNLANRAVYLGAIAPSGARFVGRHFDRMDQGAIIIIPFGFDHKEGTRHRSLR